MSAPSGGSGGGQQDLLSNILCVNMTDPLAISVAKFLAPLVQQRTEGLEIEGKLGILRPAEGRAGNVFEVPLVSSIVALTPQQRPPWRFESALPPALFTHLQTKVLNGRVEHSRVTRQGLPVEYSKTVTKDTFHHVNGERVRVTRDPATGAVLACIIKRKPALANVDFYCPGAQVTFRISACYEDKVPMPPTEAIETREKERRSYRTGLWSVDLTTVTAYTASRPSERAVSHEVEVEVVPEQLPRLRAAMDRARAGNTGDFTDIVGALVTTLRTLGLWADPALPVPPACVVTQQQRERSQQQQQQQQRQPPQPQGSGSGGSAEADVQLPCPAAPTSSSSGSGADAEAK